MRPSEYLSLPPITITASTSPRSHGGKHDYFSEGDYWWPDPKNPGGPYIRRDGYSNPANFNEHREALIRLSLHVPALVAAWLITRDKRYARHAALHLRAWFLDPATKMNPSLDYAQAIFGISPGRGTGVIDTLHLVEVSRAARHLEKAGVLHLRRVRRSARLVHAISQLDVHLEERQRGRSRKEQSWCLLGGASGRIRSPHRKPRGHGALPRPLPEQSSARPIGAQRQLPSGTRAHQTLQLFAFRPRRARDHLPDCFHQ